MNSPGPTSDGHLASVREQVAEAGIAANDYVNVLGVVVLCKEVGTAAQCLGLKETLAALDNGRIGVPEETVAGQAEGKRGRRWGGAPPAARSRWTSAEMF
jgi:hypothetical protein